MNIVIKPPMSPVAMAPDPRWSGPLFQANYVNESGGYAMQVKLPAVAHGHGAQPAWVKLGADVAAAEAIAKASTVPAALLQAKDGVIWLTTPSVPIEAHKPPFLDLDGVSVTGTSGSFSGFSDGVDGLLAIIANGQVIG